MLHPMNPQITHHREPLSEFHLDTSENTIDLRCDID